jgi:hypothetical protein
MAEAGSLVYFTFRADGNFSTASLTQAIGTVCDVVSFPEDGG